MSAEHGVYVELLPVGKIKRDLAGILGEVPLAETKISDEILLFSELIFEPYAAVVDQIRSQASAILMHDDHGGLANMTLFQFMLDTVEDLVSTLEQENPPAIQEYAESFGFGVVRDLVGHGIGTEMHEAPEIPNFAQRRKGIRLAAGMTLAIEPMITAGRYDVVWEDDGWTVVTEDGSLASHYENTILITDGEPEILSL